MSLINLQNYLDKDIHVLITKLRNILTRYIMIINNLKVSSINFMKQFVSNNIFHDNAESFGIEYFTFVLYKSFLYNLSFITSDFSKIKYRCIANKSVVYTIRFVIGNTDLVWYVGSARSTTYKHSSGNEVITKSKIKKNMWIHFKDINKGYVKRSYNSLYSINNYMR